MRKIQISKVSQKVLDLKDLTLTYIPRINEKNR